MLKPSTSLAEDAQLTIEEVFLDVSINGLRKGTVVLLRSENSFFVEAQDLRRWRIRLPNTTPLKFYGEDFYSLDALAGLTYTFDVPTQ